MRNDDGPRAIKPGAVGGKGRERGGTASPRGGERTVAGYWTMNWPAISSTSVGVSASSTAAGKGLSAVRTLR